VRRARPVHPMWQARSSLQCSRCQLDDADLGPETEGDRWPAVPSQVRKVPIIRRRTYQRTAAAGARTWTHLGHQPWRRGRGLKEGIVVGSRRKGCCLKESGALGAIVIRGGNYAVIFRRITDTF
jgi:hypothetical protein